MKKSLRLIAALLTLSLLTGACALAETVTAQDILARDYSEHMTITYANSDAREGVDYTRGNDYYAWWADTFNYDLEVTALTAENRNQNITTWANADDLPDWSVWVFNAGDARSWVDQGLLKKLPDDWREKYPNLSRAADSVPANAHYEELFGGMYFLFRPAFDKNFPADVKTNHFSLYVRTDWAEQAGYDLTKNNESGTITISEYLDYCRAVKAAGLCEYASYDSSLRMGFLISMCSEADGFNQSPFYKGEDGKYHWGPAEAETGIKETLRKFHDAYVEGLIYPEFYTLTMEDGMGHFNAAGDTATASYQGAILQVNTVPVDFEANLGLNFWEHCNIYVLTDDSGVAHDDPFQNHWGTEIFAPDISDEKLDRILSIMDYTCTDEGTIMQRMGFEGVDWEYDENGEPASILINTEYKSLENKYNTYSSPHEGFFVLTDDFGFKNPTYSAEARAKCLDLYTIRAGVTSVKGEEPDWDYLDYSSAALSQATMVYYDEYAYIVAKDGDFDANYDEWVAEKMGLIQPVLDDLNAKFCN